MPDIVENKFPAWLHCRQLTIEKHILLQGVKLYHCSMRLIARNSYYNCRVHKHGWLGADGS